MVAGFGNGGINGMLCQPHDKDSELFYIWCDWSMIREGFGEVFKDPDEYRYNGHMFREGLG